MDSLEPESLGPWHGIYLNTHTLEVNKFNRHPSQGTHDGGTVHKHKCGRNRPEQDPHD